MAKLDWTKAGQLSSDPARVQRVNDFVEPDREIVTISELTADDRRRFGQGKGKGKRAKLKTARKAKKPSVTQQRPMTVEEKRQAAEQRRRADEERQLAKAEHQQRYLAKTARLLSEAAAKRKSHFEAWLEKQRAAYEDRKVLNQEWRWKLLQRRSEDKE